MLELDDLQSMHHRHLLRMQREAKAALLRTTQWDEPYRQFHFWQLRWSREQLESLVAVPFMELAERFPIELPGPDSDLHGSTIPPTDRQASAHTPAPGPTV